MIETVTAIVIGVVLLLGFFRIGYQIGYQRGRHVELKRENATLLARVRDESR